MKGLFIKCFILFLIVILKCNLLTANDWQTAMDSYKKAMQKNDFEKALNFAYESMNYAINEFGINSEYYASSLGKLGEVYYVLQNYDSSLKYYLNQREILKQISKDTTDNFAYSCNNISVIYQQLGRFQDAEVYLKESLEIKKILKGEMDTSYAKSLHNLGNVYKQLVDYEQAEKVYLRSLEIKKALLDPENISIALTAFNLGNIYNELGIYSKAKILLEECAGIYKNKLGTKSKEYKQTILVLADIYIKLGETKRAENLIDENIGSDKDIDKEQADILFTKALIKYKSNDFENAEKLFLKAKSIIEKTLGTGSPLYSSCINNLGIISWRLNKKQEAYKYLKEATLLKERNIGKSNPDFVVTVHNLAGLLKDLGKLDEADKYYKEAFDLYLNQIKIFFPFLSDSEKEKFYGKLRNRIALFNCYAIERMKTKPDILCNVYDYQIATKALLLNNSINVRKKILESKDDELISTFLKWKTIKEELAKVYKIKKSRQSIKTFNIDSLDNIANNLEKKLSTNPYFKKEYAKEFTSWTQIQKQLKSDEAAVEIIRFPFKHNADVESDTIIYLALILTSETKDYPESVIFYNGNDLENFFIYGYQNAISLELDDNYSYSNFWEKIDAKLGNKKIIYVSQDGIYNNINLNTLKLPDGSYLIDKKDIIIVSNTADLLELRKDNWKDWKLKTNKSLLIGYPKFFIEPTIPQNYEHKIRIQELPGTKTEIEEIKQILEQNNNKIQLILDEQAVKPLFSKLKDYSIIHIATHGYFKSNVDLTKYDNLLGIDVEVAAKNPLLRSGLIFAGAENTINNIPLDTSLYDDGFLNAYDVMNLDLDNANLVVLSACQTGIGEIRNGDGVYGLQRAFFVAGAKSLIMSLWKVQDQTTQELMVLFYKYLVENSDIYNAFKKAQIELRKKYPHPIYWGPFLVIGNIK